MSNYLLECEIVGGEISNAPRGEKNKTNCIFVSPRTVFQPSANLIAGGKKSGIAVEESGECSFKAGENVIAIPFDEQGDCVKLPCSDAAIAAQILACKNGKVVLELVVGAFEKNVIEPDEANVVGFKAKF